MTAPTRPYGERLRELVHHLRDDNAMLRHELELVKRENASLRQREGNQS